MRSSTTVSKLSKWLSWLAASLLALLPFHAFLTVWAGSSFGNYTLIRLWKEILLVVLVAGCLYLLVKDTKLRQEFMASWVTKLIAVYGVISLLWGLASYGLGNVTLKALGYGVIVNLRFLLFFLSVWIIATPHKNSMLRNRGIPPLLRSGFSAGQAKSQWLWKAWPKLLLIPAAIVVIVGLLQRFILPFDVLKHFGYSSETIFPYQTVNYNINYPRVMSTLRGANPLGAYLVLILSALAVLGRTAQNRRWFWWLLTAAALLTIILSYSRGAWLGLALSMLFLAWVLLKRQTKRIIMIGLGMLLAFGIGFGLAVRGNSGFENAFFHTDSRSNTQLSSNEEHLKNIKAGFSEVVSEPLGRGLGTAGPASVYNQPAGKSRIADNYFVQIAQELGWLGVGLFVAINVMLARQLWLRRQEALALALLVSLIGLTAVNLVSHAWADDTLAYIWWGLAGVALATPAVTSRKVTSR